MFVDNDNRAALGRSAARHDSVGQLPEVTCPVLVLYGTELGPFEPGPGDLDRGLERFGSLPGCQHSPSGLGELGRQRRIRSGCGGGVVDRVGELSSSDDGGDIGPVPGQDGGRCP